MEPTIIGIIGCGSISDAYLHGAARSRLVRVKSVADIRADAANAKAAEFSVQAVPVESLLADPDIEVVVNLTVPAAHAPVSLQIIEAGVSWNYTTLLNIAALALSAALAWRFLRTGGPEMLRMME